MQIKLKRSLVLLVLGCSVFAGVPSHFVVAGDELKASMFSSHGLGAVISLNAALQYLEGVDRQLELPFSGDDANVKEQILTELKLSLQALNQAGLDLDKYSGGLGENHRIPASESPASDHDEFTGEQKKVGEARKQVSHAASLCQLVIEKVQGVGLRPTKAALRDMVSRLRTEVQSSLDATKSLKGAS